MINNKHLLIIGAGLFGATVAYNAIQAGWTVEVIEKRNHIGGNCYTVKRDGIDVHLYGAHIFHTDHKKTWDFINQFGEFWPYRHRIKAKYKNKIYSFPFNLQTINEVYGPTNIKDLESLFPRRDDLVSPNLEEWCINEVGPIIYELFIKNYTEKQWGRPTSDLPPTLIKRLPFRDTYNDDYFTDRYQGIPVEGYTTIIEKMLEGAHISTGVDYLEQLDKGLIPDCKILYTGKLDAYFSNCLGKLDYRSLHFQHFRKEKPNVQGISVINFTDSTSNKTRSIEHRHFMPEEKTTGINYSWITNEYPEEHNEKNEPFYPIPTKENLSLANQYKDLAKKEKNVWFGGRLVDYKYYDMDDTIISAQAMWKKIKDSNLESQKNN